MNQIEYTRVLTRPAVLGETLSLMGAEGWDVFHVQDDAMYKGARMFMLLGKRYTNYPALVHAVDYPDGTVVDAADWAVAPKSLLELSRTATRLIPDPNVCQCPAPCVVHTD